MRTSYSALSTYKTCPLKYKYEQIDKIKTPKRIEAVFGTLVHSALKYMFERTPLYHTLDEVINFYTEKWNEKSEAVEWRNPDKKDAEGKMYFEEGIKIIKNFYKKNQPWTFSVVELEGRFSLELEDESMGQVHTLAGIIDRIDKDPNSDVYEIIDSKTGKRMPAEKDLESDLQLGLYHLALSVRWPQIKPGDIKTSLYFLRHNEKISTTPTKDTLKNTKDYILSTIREIEERTESGQFPPTPGPLCDYCGHRKICPMWSHEYKNKEVDIKSEEEIVAAIQEFFEIKNLEDTNKKRLAHLRADILAYMESKKINRVFGTPGYITKTAQERVSFDMDKVKELLTKSGKWEAILAPDSKKLEELLPSLPQEVKDKIRESKIKKEVVVLKATKKNKGIEEE